MNQNCKVCGEVAAGYHFGAFTCEGCKSFFGRTYNNSSSIGECKNNNSCVINKKNRTSCKSCRLKKCFSVGMSKSGSRYGRRSNWFKIHCLLQDQGLSQHQQQSLLPAPPAGQTRAEHHQDQPTNPLHQLSAQAQQQLQSQLSLQQQQQQQHPDQRDQQPLSTHHHHHLGQPDQLQHHLSHLSHDLILNLTAANHGNHQAALAGQQHQAPLSPATASPTPAAIPHQLAAAFAAEQANQAAAAAAAAQDQAGASPTAASPMIDPQLYANAITQFLIYNLLVSQRSAAQ